MADHATAQAMYTAYTFEGCKKDLAEVKMHELEQKEKLWRE